MGAVLSICTNLLPSDMLSVFVLKRRTDGLGEQNLNLPAVCECFSYRRSRKGQCAMEFSGGLDNFLKAVATIQRLRNVSHGQH